MTNLEFRYWLHGFYELSEDLVLDEKQIKIIKNHADLVKRTEGKLDEDIQRFLTQLKKHLNISNVIQELIQRIVIS